MNSASVDLIYAAPVGSAAAGAAFKDIWTLSGVDVEWINLIEAKHPALYRVLLAAMTNSRNRAADTRKVPRNSKFQTEPLPAYVF